MQEKVFTDQETGTTVLKQVLNHFEKKKPLVYGMI